MSDPLSTTANVIAVATVAYQSCKKLRSTIQGFKNAPETFESTARDLDMLQQVLYSLQYDLQGVGDRELSTNQQICFQSLRFAMQGCQELCNNFTTRLAKLSSNSGPGELGIGDRLRINFNETEIFQLKESLGQYKQTFEIALAHANLNTARKNQQTLDMLDTKLTESVTGLTGQIHGLEYAMQALSLSSANIAKQDVAEVVKVLNEHDQMLKTCLKVCTAAFADISEVSGTTVKHARAFDEARQLTGNVGIVSRDGPPVRIEVAEARNKARQFNGSMSAEAAKDFWA